MTHGTVVSADRLATDAGIGILRAGGTAVDAAITTNAMLAVLAPHLCGVGGDLLALVHTADEPRSTTPAGSRTASGQSVACLISAGRAGSGADAESLRAEGRTTMPMFGDIRSVTVPGCVDGWLALHEAYGTLPLTHLLAQAIDAAETGFPASPLLVGACRAVDEPGRAALSELVSQATEAGARVTRPGLGRSLRAVASEGRSALYEGEFGRGLLSLGGGWFSERDLTVPLAEWVAPLRATAFGVDLWTAPPVSQGYLWLAAAVMADQLDLPDPDDPAWAHLLAECAVAAARDRPAVLSDGADGHALLAAAAGRLDEVDHRRATRTTAPSAAGDTTYLAVVDEHGTGVSLIQSNASGFGSRLVEPNTGINLHNRGLGFSLTPGHPAELRAGARPPHTLVPGLATDAAGLRAVLGTMGGDAQPQVLLQLAARLFRHGQPVRQAVESGRWALQGGGGFDTWTSAELRLAVEGQAPEGWAMELRSVGHHVVQAPPYDSSFGHANAIVRTPDGWAAAADPRTVVGSASAV